MGGCLGLGEVLARPGVSAIKSRVRVSDGMRQQRRRGGERTWSGRERDWGRQQHRYCLISAAILDTGQLV
jgi:hypothetical protein